MAQDLETIVRRWFDEVWNQGREETIDELFAQDGLIYGLGESEAPVRGPEEFKPFFHNLRSSFPDVRVDIDHLVIQDNRVALCMDIKGTHKGAGLGIEPTGLAVHVRGMVIATVANGQIVAAQNLWDQLGMWRQLGMAAGPETHVKNRYFEAAG